MLDEFESQTLPALEARLKVAMAELEEEKYKLKQIED